MLADVYSPGCFDDIVGQELATAILKTLVSKSNLSGPRLFVFHGERGVGKTSAARVFTMAINKRDKVYTDIYQEILEVSNETIENGFSKKPIGKRVILMDEFNLIPRKNQIVLLEAFNKAHENVFLILNTVELGKVLNAVRDRAVEIPFRILLQEEIEDRLRYICEAEKFKVDDKYLQAFCLYAKGNLRKAINYLERLCVMGEDIALETLETSEANVLRLIITLRKGSRKEYEEAVNEVCKSPLVYVRESFYEVLRNAIISISTEQIPVFYTGLYDDLLNVWSYDIFKLFQVVMQSWANNSFNHDLTLQAFLWSLHYNIGAQRKKDDTSSLASRARKK